MYKNISCSLMKKTDTDVMRYQPSCAILEYVKIGKKY